MGVADTAETALFERDAPRNPLPRRKVDRFTWRAGLAHPDEDARISAVFEPLVPALTPALTACLPPPTQLPLGTSVGYRIHRTTELVFERVVHERAWIPTAVDDACVLRALRAHPWPDKVNDAVVVLAVLGG